MSLQAALEAPRVLNLNSSKYFSGPYGMNMIYIYLYSITIQYTNKYKIMIYFLFDAGEDVVFIANDWHTALLPCYLKSMYQSLGMYISAKVRL